MDKEEKKYWIMLNVFNGIGPARFKLLYDFFGNAKSIFSATEQQLLEIGLNQNLVSKFSLFKKEFDFETYCNNLKKENIIATCLNEENYPKLLKEIPDPPFVLYTKGNIEILAKKGVAIVGSRNMSGYGRQVTQSITEGLVMNNIVIVSGLARGVDKIAHQTTLDNNGKTIAVLGCGLDMIYPPEHIPLAKEIVEKDGCLVSEYPIGTKAMPGNFPARNRIISGLSLGVVVTEATEDSGSLITASCAGEQGREVFAVPGPITSSLSKGTFDLIKKGATPVGNHEDILLNLGLSSRSKKQQLPENLSEDEKKILSCLETSCASIDKLSELLKIECSVLGGILSMMEMKNLVFKDGKGDYYSN